MHPLLARQLQQHLGDPAAHSEELRRFIAAVDDAYQQNDRDRAMLERSMALSSRELVERNDELNNSLRRLKEVQRQLLEASRRMGMADVASSVLHNVGNVLNSVNVSAGIVADTARGSRLRALTKVADLLRKHQGDRVEFLTRDEKGMRIPEFVCQLADAADQERAALITELETLQKNIDHIKVIVSTQQAHARGGGVIETLDIRDLLEDTIKVNFDAHQHSWVARDYAGPHQISADRHKLMQILLNLLSNARHAVRERASDTPAITIRTKYIGSERLSIEIEDNGVGMPTENLAKIFTHGFTTKKDGHGFGLHSSSCAALELGGTLTAHSDGPNRGARFTLELPTLGSAAHAPKKEPVQGLSSFRAPRRSITPREIPVVRERP